MSVNSTGNVRMQLAIIQDQCRLRWNERLDP